MISRIWFDQLCKVYGEEQVRLFFAPLPYQCWW